MRGSAFSLPGKHGKSSTRNSGIARVHVEYLAFLDDDEWLPGKLAAQVAVLDAAPPEVGLVFSALQFGLERDRPGGYGRRRWPETCQKRHGRLSTLEWFVSGAAWTMRHAK